MDRQVITSDIRQTASFSAQARSARTCIEFGLFETDDKRRLLSSDIVVGEEAPKPEQVSSGFPPQD